MKRSREPAPANFTSCNCRESLPSISFRVTGTSYRARLTLREGRDFSHLESCQNKDNVSAHAYRIAPKLF